MSYLEDVSKLKRSAERASRFAMAADQPDSDIGNGIKSRVSAISSHLFHQIKEHDEATLNTNHLFNQLLDDLDPVCHSFRQTFFDRDMPLSNISSYVDADRSVGILNILWHGISFTTRGNTKPLALHRSGRQPIFTGRIVALYGDYREIATDFQDLPYTEMLQFEIASLYIPADMTSPAVMTARHMEGQESFFSQTDAAHQFLFKTIEMVCSGGFFHEKEI